MRRRPDVFMSSRHGGAPRLRRREIPPESARASTSTLSANTTRTPTITWAINRAGGKPRNRLICFHRATVSTRATQETLLMAPHTHQSARPRESRSNGDRNRRSYVRIDRPNQRNLDLGPSSREREGQPEDRSRENFRVAEPSPASMPPRE